jgi:hypothetical protein
MPEVMIVPVKEVAIIVTRAINYKDYSPLGRTSRGFQV